MEKVLGYWNPTIKNMKLFSPISKNNPLLVKDSMYAILMSKQSYVSLNNESPLG